jgi:hypothetical protein
MFSSAMLRASVRTLAVAGMLALAVSSIPAVHAHAEPKGGGDYGLCQSPRTGDDVIYLPGDVTVNDQGQVVQCQPDGTWTVLFRTSVHHLPVAPVSIGVIGR